jgi:hypothetical protein
MERGRRLLVLIGVTALAGAAVLAAPASARLLHTRDQSLRQVFGPGARFEARTAWLSNAECDSASAWAQSPLRRGPVTYWVATAGDSVVGRAYLDTRTVRTMPATVLVAVDPHQRVLAVEVLAFHEPADYLPSERWLSRLTGRVLTRRLRPGAEVDAVSGATLSARAFTAAVRLALALDRLVAREHS